MIRFKKIILLILLFNLYYVTICYADHALTTSLNSDEHVVWHRAPIQISLPVDQERLVSFPEEVQFGYNTARLSPSVLRVENDHQTLYLLAKKSFSPERTEAKLADGSIILIDLNAKKNTSAANELDTHPIDIVLPETINNNSISKLENNTSSVSYISLTRYAIQQLYAPERLLKNSLFITRFPMNTQHVVPLVYDGSLTAMPLASWRGNDLYITALLVKNMLDQPLRLDPRRLCGNWKAASFYPKTTLAAQGTPINQDTSTLFLVSDRPFMNAIQACLN